MLRFRSTPQVDNEILSKLSFYFPIYSDITLVKYIQDTDHVTNVMLMWFHNHRLKMFH